MYKLLKYPKIILFTCLAVTGLFIFELKGITVENTLRMFFPHSHSSWQRLIQTEDQFGSMIAMGISIEAKGDSAISDAMIQAVKNISHRVEDLEFVEDVDSLSNIDFVYEDGGALVAENLVNDSYTGTKEDVDLVKQKVEAWRDMYNKVIVSQDGHALQIAVTLDNKANTKQTTQTLREIRNIVSEEVKGMNVHITYFGDPVLSENMKLLMTKDLICLIPLVIIVVLVSLFISFKTFDGTYLPLITVLISTIWSCGIMSLCHVTFTLVSSVIPVALIAVGSAYGIHVLTHYYIALDKVEGPINREKHIECILFAIKDVWQAVSLAGITTIVGFVSLVTSPIGPLHSFALFTALGVFFSLILSVTLIPSILALKPIDKIGKKSRVISKVTERLQRRIQKHRARALKTSRTQLGVAQTLFNIYRVFAGTKPRLSLFCLAMIILSVIGIRKLVVDTSLVSYFSPSSVFRRDLDYIDNNFAGSNSLYFLISGQNKGDMCRVEILKAMDDMQDYLEKRHSNIGKIVSFTTFLKRMNQVLHVPQKQIDSYNINTSVSDSDIGEAEDIGFDSFEGFDTFDFTDITGFDNGDKVDNTQTSDIEPYIDPLPAQAEKLDEVISLEDLLTILSRSYAVAGGKNASIEDVVIGIEKAFNFNGASYYEVPFDVAKYPATKREELANLVSQYLLLFSGSLDKFNDDPLSPRVCRMQVELRTHSTKDTDVIVRDALAFAAKSFPDGYTLEATGNGKMECVMTQLVISSQVASLIFSIISVFIILAFSFKSPIAGCIGILPLGFTIILNYMTMGQTNISLDFLTSIIASVAVGVGIDYTIHFMTTYKGERAASDTLDDVILLTFNKSGLGIITNALAVGLGFLVLCLSNFVVLRYIGLLVALVMFTSSFLALTLIPAILKMLDPKFVKHDKAK